MSVPTSARAVANYFLDRGDEDLTPIDQLKLQKLVYYAFAWFAANNSGDALFDEDIQAWPHGPVVPELWKDFRNFGREPITGRAYEIAYTASGLKRLAPNVDDEQVRAFLEKIWETYKGYDGIQLSNMTHDDDEPWAAIRKMSDLSNKPRIPTPLITKMFREKISNASEGPA